MKNKFAIQENLFKVKEVRFEWDEAKRQANRKKHGLDLAEACALRDTPVYVLESHHPTEPCKLALGMIAEKHWTVIFTVRADRIRLISARRSREDERKIYNENHRQEP